MGTTTSRDKHGAPPLSGWHATDADAHLDPLVHVKLLVSSGEHTLHPHMQGTEVDFFARSMDHLQSHLRVVTGHTKSPFHIVTRTAPHMRLGTIGDIEAHHEKYPDVRLAATPDDVATLHPHKDALHGGDKRRLEPSDAGAKRSRGEVGVAKLADDEGHGEEKGDEEGHGEEKGDEEGHGEEKGDEEGYGERKGDDGDVGEGEKGEVWTLDDVLKFAMFGMGDLFLQQMMGAPVPMEVHLFSRYEKLREFASTPPYDNLDMRADAFCKVVEWVSNRPDMLYLLPIIAQLWDMKPSKKFAHASMRKLPRELRNFLIGRTPEWAPRPKWLAVQKAAHQMNVAKLANAIKDLKWILPSETEWLLDKVSNIQDYGLQNAITSLSGLATPRGMGMVGTLTTRRFVKSILQIVQGRLSVRDLDIFSRSETNVDEDEINEAVRATDTFKFQDLTNLIRHAPATRGVALWSTIMMMMTKGDDTGIFYGLDDTLDLLNVEGHMVFREELIPVMIRFWKYITLLKNLVIRSLTSLCIIVRSFDCVRKVGDFDGIAVFAKLLNSVYITKRLNEAYFREHCRGCDWETCLAALHFLGTVYLPEEMQKSVMHAALSRNSRFMLELAVEMNRPGEIGHLLSDATFRRSCSLGSVVLAPILDRGMRRGKLAAINELCNRFRTRGKSFLTYLMSTFVPSAEAVQAVIDMSDLAPIVSGSLVQMMPAVEFMRAFQREGHPGMQRVWKKRGHSEPALIKFMVANVALVAPPDRAGAARILIGRGDTQACAGDLMVANEWEFALDVIEAAKTAECKIGIARTLEDASDLIVDRLVRRRGHMKHILKALQSNHLVDNSFFCKVANAVPDEIDPLWSEFAEATHVPAELPRLESLPDAPEGDHPIFMSLGDCSIFYQVIGTCYLMSSMASMFMTFNSPETTTLWHRCFTIAHKVTKTGRVIPIPVDIRKDALAPIIQAEQGSILFLFLCFVHASLRLQAEMLAAGDALGEHPSGPRVYSHFKDRFMVLTHTIETISLQNKVSDVSWATASAKTEGGIPIRLVSDFVTAVGLDVSSSMVDMNSKYVVWDAEKTPKRPQILQSRQHAMSIHAEAVPKRGRYSHRWFFGNPQYRADRFRLVRNGDKLYKSPIITKVMFTINDSVGRSKAPTTKPEWYAASASVKPFIESVLAAGLFPRKTLLFLDSLYNKLQIHPSTVQLIIGEQTREGIMSAVATLTSVTDTLLDAPR